MARRFTASGDDVLAALEGQEIDLLVRLFHDVAELLAPVGAAPTHPWAAELGLDDLALDGVGAGDDEPAQPEDPALRRLLPPARRDDPEAAAEFRRFTERGLRDRKRAGLERALQVMARWQVHPDDEQRLSRSEAADVATGLTDVRLVLGQRLGLETDDDAEDLHDRAQQDLDPHDPFNWLTLVYDFVTWVQESLTQLLLDQLPLEGDGRRRAPDPSEGPDD